MFNFGLKSDLRQTARRPRLFLLDKCQLFTHKLWFISQVLGQLHGFLTAIEIIVKEIGL